MKSEKEESGEEDMNEKEFIQKIFHLLPCIIYEIELKDSGIISTFHNVRMNQRGLDFIGCTHKEIALMGFDFFEQIVHPDDLEQMSVNSKKNCHSEPKPDYAQTLRIRLPRQTEYNSFYCARNVTETFANGTLKKVLIIALEVKEIVYPDNQIAEALKVMIKRNSIMKAFDLSHREEEVLHLIVKAMSDPEIADDLSISIVTAKKHRTNLLHKTGTKNSVELALLAYKSGEY